MAARAKFPQAKLQEASESHRTSLVDDEELRDYCQTLFQFQQISYKRFRFPILIFFLYDRDC